VAGSRARLTPDEAEELLARPAIASDPWLMPLYASQARDVLARGGEVDDRTKAQRAADARSARLRAQETARANRALGCEWLNNR
jgi:hypothetical protein